MVISTLKWPKRAAHALGHRHRLGMRWPASSSQVLSLNPTVRTTSVSPSQRPWIAHPRRLRVLREDVLVKEDLPEGGPRLVYAPR